VTRDSTDRHGLPKNARVTGRPAAMIADALLAEADGPAAPPRSNG